MWEVSVADGTVKEIGHLIGASVCVSQRARTWFFNAMDIQIYCLWTARSAKRFDTDFINWVFISRYLEKGICIYKSHAINIDRTFLKLLL